MTKKRGSVKLPLRATGEDEEEIQKVSASVAAANEVSADAAAAPVLSEADDIFTLKEEQRTAPKAFMSGKALLPTDFGKSCETHRSSPRGCDLHLLSPLTLTGSLELLLLPSSTGSKGI